MITPTQNRIAGQAAPEAARRNADARPAESSFRSLFDQAAPSPAPAAKTESQPALPGPQNAAAANPFSPQSVEDHMNNWLMGVMRRQNDVRMQLYQNAVDGWKNTNARNRQLGLPEVPPPPPPELAEIAPMPAGWWFRTNA